MSLLPTEEYVEAGYLLDADYVGGIADAVGILTRYYDEGYAPDDYVANEGAVFALTADLTTALQDLAATLNSTASISADVGLLKSAESNFNSEFILGTVADGTNLGTLNANIIASGEIALTGAFAPTITVVATRSGEVLMQSTADFAATASKIAGGASLLNYQADLDAQAARILGAAASPASETTVSVLSAVIFEDSADFVCSTALSAEVDRVEFFEADLSSEFTSSANAIEYVSRFTNSDRPIGWSFYQFANGSYFPSTSYAFDSTIYKYGTHSLALTTTNRFATSDTIDLNNFNTQTGNWVFEFWYRADNITAADDVFIAQFTENTYANFESIDRFGPTPYFNDLRIYRESDTGRIAIRVADKLLLGPLGSQIDNDTWYHMAVVYTSGTLNFYLNGVLRITEPNCLIYYDNPRIHLINDIGFGNTRAWFDNVRLAINATDYHYNTDADNDLNTKILARFDGNLADDTSLTFSGAANLNTTAGLTATLNGTAQGSADLTAFYSQLSAVGRVSDFFANADMVAGANITADRIRSVVADIDSTSELSAAVNKIAAGVSTVDAISDIATVGVGVFAAASSLQTAADMVPVATKTASGASSVSAETTASATGNITANRGAELNVAGAVVAEAEIFKDTGAVLESVSSLNAGVGTIKSAEVLLSAFYSQLSAVGRVSDFFINPDVAFGLSAQAVLISAKSADLVSVSEIQIDASRSRDFDAELSGASSLVAAGVKTTDTDANISSALTVAADAQRFRSSAASMSSESTAVIDATKIPGIGFEIDAATELSATGSVIRDVNANLDCNTALSSLGGAVFEGSADLTGFVSIISINKILHVEQYVYRIPRETRIYAIPTETRSWRVQREIRIYSIQGDS